VRVGSLALSAGVLAGYHFDGNALDFSGNGFNGTWTGSAAYAAGAIAGHMAVSLNGASYIDMGLVAAIQDLVQGEFTVSAWVNLASFPQPYNFIAVTGLADGYSSGLLFPSQAPTTAAPAYVKGGIYFDTTLNKLRIGGASGWETVTSS
jgi:hypothetical protein